MVGCLNNTIGLDLAGILPSNIFLRGGVGHISSIFVKLWMKLKVGTLEFRISKLKLTC